MTDIPIHEKIPTKRMVGHNCRAMVGRRNVDRLSREILLDRAQFLPGVPRALLTAHYGLGMALEEIGLLHHLTARQVRRRLDHLRDTLADPCFLIAARYADRLPGELAALARDYWIEGRTLRVMAAARGWTLHRIRREVGVARSLLVVAFSAEQALPAEMALAAIDGSKGRKVLSRRRGGDKEGTEGLAAGME